MLEHGGHIIDAAQKYNIPEHRWIDLSTGINPNGWPVPDIPAHCWQRLPEASDNLIAAAKAYYQTNSILAVAGSQAAIQALPLLRDKSKVGVLALAYAEHAYSWKKAGHEIIDIEPLEIEQYIDNLDVLILINPNNPTGQQFSASQLLKWHDRLSSRQGWLVIDEAFIDSTPTHSLSCHPIQPGLIILRSIGKFFGLAGLRCGFVIAQGQLLNTLNEHLGPWAISHPSRFIASQALTDTKWHKSNQQYLAKNSQRLKALLTQYDLKPDGATDLFIWIKTANAKQIHHLLAKQGILTRMFTAPLSLRFGLPADEQKWQRLEQALSRLSISSNIL